jgi:beta-galactosidase GanA
MTDINGVKPALGPVPDGVEVSPRYGAKGAVYVLVNFANTPQIVKLPSAMQDVLNGGMTQSVTLPHYGVAIVALSK